MKSKNVSYAKRFQHNQSENMSVDKDKSNQTHENYALYSPTNKRKRTKNVHS
jgi:hypothetical protein